MKSLKTGGMILFALVFAACATVPKSPVVTAPSVYCLPNGVDQSVLTWPVTNVANLGLVNFVRHERDGMAVAIGWYGGIPVMYDDKPDDKTVSMMMNAQVLPNGESEIRPPVGPCVWYYTNETTT